MDIQPKVVQEVLGNLKRLIYLEKGYFLFAKLFLFVARTWLDLKVSFFRARKLGSRPENPFFCHRTPNFVDGPFVAPGETVHFQPSDRFFVLRPFRKKKRPRAKKSSPTPLWGHRLPVTALALSARAG